MITNKSSVIRLGASQPWPVKSYSLVWFQYHLNARLKLFFQKYFDDKFFQNRGISFSHVLLKFFSSQLHLEVFLHDSKLYDFYSTKPSHRAIALIRNFRYRRVYRKLFKKAKKIRLLQLKLFRSLRKKRLISHRFRLSAVSFTRPFSFSISSKKRRITGYTKNFVGGFSSVSPVESLFKKSYYFKKRFLTPAKWSKFLAMRLKKRRKIRLFKPVLPRSRVSGSNFRYNYLLFRRRSKLVDFLEYKARKKFLKKFAKRQKFFANFFRKGKRKFFSHFKKWNNKRRYPSKYGKHGRRRKYTNIYKRRARRRALSRFHKFYTRRRRLIIKHFYKVARLRIRKLYLSTLAELKFHVDSTLSGLSPIFRRFMLKRFWTQYRDKKKAILINLAVRRRVKILYLRGHPYLRRWGLRFFGKKQRASKRKNKKLALKKKNLKQKKNIKGSKKLRGKRQDRVKNRKFIKLFSKKFNKKSRTNRLSKRQGYRAQKRRRAPVSSTHQRADRFVFFTQYSASSSAKFIRYRFYHFLAKFLSAQLFLNLKLPLKVSFSFFPIHRAGSDFYLNYITAKLYYRYILSDIIKPIVKISLAFYRGFVISCKGRFTRAQMAVSKKFVKRSVSYSRISSLLDYGQRAVVLKYGTCNLRIWIRK